MTWNAFYVVTSVAAVKFGVTSGDGRHRLRTHSLAGFSDVIRLETGLADLVAPDTETAVRLALADAGEKPVRGREYFDISCLALVLDVADSWLAVQPDAPTGSQVAVATWVQEPLFAA